MPCHAIPLKYHRYLRYNGLILECNARRRKLIESTDKKHISKTDCIKQNLLFKTLHRNDGEYFCVIFQVTLRW
jgi:hypothetical protein